MKTIGCYIDGAFEPGEGAPLVTLNPATGATLAQGAAASLAQADRAVTAARQAAPQWRRTPAEVRAEWLRAIADLLEARADDLAGQETDETGMLLTLTQQGHLPRAIHCFRYFADAILQSEESFSLAGAYQTLVQRDPLGVVAVIAPWNAPLAVASINLAAALAVGNCVVLKPSERSPSTSLVFGEIASELELPCGVLNILQGGPEIGQALSAAPGVNGVCFVGGVDAGRQVMASAAPSLKRLLLELGGKSPTIVFADCDFEQAVDGALLAAFSSNGEVCAAGSRILVEDRLHARFVEAISARAAQIRLGDPRRASTEMGPLIDLRHAARIERFVHHAVDQGARATTPIGRPDHLGGGAYHRPVVLDRVDPSMTIAREEVFGPVVAVMPFADAAQAVTLANDTAFGLHASIWSQDLQKAFKLAREIEAGSVALNAAMVRDIRAPFGGCKLSGLGRTGGRWSLDAFSEPKSIALALDPYPLPRLGIKAPADELVHASV